MLELTGIDRYTVKLFAKVIPIMKHYIYSSYRISTQTYGSKTDPIGGIG